MPKSQKNSKNFHKNSNNFHALCAPNVLITLHFQTTFQGNSQTVLGIDEITTPWLRLFRP
jgi:hypothetical protein